MAPIPQDLQMINPQFVKPAETMNQPVPEDDAIIISGMSGMYPKAQNIKEFADILYKKENLIQENKGTRWQVVQPELTEYVGMTQGINRFDSQFFTLSYFLGQHTDPMLRKIIEHTFQALYDAGLNPQQLSGKNIAVIVGTAYSSTTRQLFMKSMSSKGLSLLGSAKTMCANRISYWLNVKGPSITIDEGDCSSTSALEQAYLAMRRGDCDAAIVAGANFCLYPHGVIHHGRIGLLSKDGKVKSFSKNANGYVLSDAVGVLILQKSKHALRCYAELLHVKSEFVSAVGNEKQDETGYYRNPKTTAKFLANFYDEAQISPHLIEYAEGFGTGIPEADKSELEAIEDIFCKERRDTLLVGSVISNIGFTESVSGIASITKVLLGYHKGELAANLYYEPRQDIKALDDGRMQIVAENQSFNRTYAAVNGKSMTGTNSHVLFRGHYKPKDLSPYATTFPYLITVSSRQVSNVKNVFDDLKSRPVDAEEIALLHNIHSENISGNMGRGFIILDTDTNKKTVVCHESISHFDDKRKPVWFVYSGMGSQWAGMGIQLMRIPIFASAIQRCQQVLSPYGVDVVSIITSADKSIFDNILHSFIGISAVQIGLTDIVKALGLEPDGIIGHSVGEVGCAYADGCSTLEETILTSYYRGLVSSTSTFIRGAMAAVGLGFKQVHEMCPPEIDVACRNSAQSCTISGPADVIEEFLTHLTKKGIFAKQVQSGNIAYHSRYIAHAAPKLLKHLKGVIKNPKRRNKRWISTSVPQNKWDEPEAKYSSAEYHINNVLNPVLFEEASELIPSNAVLIEVAPHGLLQAILNRSAGKTWRNIPLTKRGHSDNTLHLLQSIGNIYMEGIPMNLQALYPQVQFPVSTETPMLSHLVEWYHSDTWNVPSHVLVKKIEATWNFSQSVRDKEYSYLRGNVIRQKMCFPFAAALVSVWDAYSMELGVAKRSFSISFEDVQLYSQPLLFHQKTFQFRVSVKRTSGWFEVRNEYSRMITGFIFKNNSLRPYNRSNDKEPNAEYEDIKLNSDDVYQLLNERGYDYRGDFRSIELADTSFSNAAIAWSNNWVTFIDGMLQLNVLRQTHTAVLMPTYIRNITIDVGKQTKSFNSRMEKNIIEAFVDSEQDITRCGGVTLQYIQYRNLPAHIPITPKLSTALIKIDTIHENNTEKETFSNHEINNVDWTQINDFHHELKLPIKVHFAGLNEFDVSKFTGLESLNVLGMDYSGVTKRGERVMGLVSYGAANSQVYANPELIWPIPKHWSLEEAVTVPFAYSYAFYALVINGNLQPGSSILIHEGTNPLGQAAIAIALAHNCQVYTTVNNVDQKQLLLQLFHQLPEEHIANTQDLNSLYAIILNYEENGFDMVLSGVKGEMKYASLKYCKYEGSVIDTVHTQYPEDVPMAYLGKRSFITIEFPSIFKEDKIKDMKIMQKLVSDGIAAGYVVPLPTVNISSQELERGIKLIERGQNIGRVVLSMCNDTQPTKYGLSCDPEKYQILLWNEEVLGVQLTEKLIQLGAKNLFIICSELTSYQLFKLRIWKKIGVQIEVVSDNLTTKLLLNESLIGSIGVENIEGIFVIYTADKSIETITDFTSYIDRLDSQSRSPGCQIRNFVVISTVNDFATNIYVSRSKSALPATWIDLSTLKNKRSFSADYVIHIMENKGAISNITLNLEAEQFKPTSLFDEIVSLSGLSIPNTVSTDTTLKELGIQDGAIELISKFLETNYNVSLEKIELSQLTLSQLHNMEEYVTDFIPNKIKGLQTFISHVYSDEMLGTAELLVLQTLSQNIISIENDYEITGKFLCILPGIEGHHERFSDVCERLKIPAMVLQPGLDHQNETTKETAERYAKILSKRTDMQNHFYLLGYETGAMVAIELAIILENQGLTGTVFCLGYTPQELQVEIEQQLKEFVTEAQLHNAVISHIYKLLLDQNPTELEEKLQDINTWTEKVDLCMKYITGRTTHSSEFIRKFIESTLVRITNARQNFVIDRPLRSKVVVLRAASDFDSPETTKILSTLPIITHQLQFPLSCASRDKNCSAIINQYLGDDVLEEFESKNTCVHYFVQQD